MSTGSIRKQARGSCEFNPDKIASFEEKKAPVDIYAAGSFFLGGSCDFTADLVMVDGERESKTGREYRPVRPRS